MEKSIYSTRQLNEDEPCRKDQQFQQLRKRKSNTFCVDLVVIVVVAVVVVLALLLR